MHISSVGVGKNPPENINVVVEVSVELSYRLTLRLSDRLTVQVSDRLTA